MQSKEHGLMETFVFLFLWSLPQVLRPQGVGSWDQAPGQDANRNQSACFLWRFLESRGSPVPSQVGITSWFRGCVLLIACRARETFVSSRPNSPVSKWQWRTEEVSSYPLYAREFFLSVYSMLDSLLFVGSRRIKGGLTTQVHMKRKLSYIFRWGRCKNHPLCTRWCSGQGCLHN